MHRAVDQVQVQAVLTFADDDAFLGQRYFRIGGVAQVGHEDALPQGRALSALHVLHIENYFGKSFVEDAGLDFERNLRAFESIFQVAEGGLGAGRDVESVDQRQGPGADDEDGEHAEEAPHAHAAGAHGGDFTVGGESAEADEDADQHAHGQRVGEGEWDGEKENLGDAGQWGAGADYEFEDATEVAREQDEGEDGHADQRVGRHFT